jgi:hypothetical protein
MSLECQGGSAQSGGVHTIPPEAVPGSGAAAASPASAGLPVSLSIGGAPVIEQLDVVGSYGLFEALGTAVPACLVPSAAARSS